MHELALCQAIADTVTAHADERPVRRIHLRIGHLRQVVPDALTFSWQLVTERGPLDGSELVIDHVPAVVACPACGATTRLEHPLLLCPACGDDRVELRCGDEFLVVAVEVAEAAR